MKATLATVQPRWNKYLFPAIIVIFLVLAGLFVYNAQKTRLAASIPPGSAHISLSALEEQYGLRLNLVAATAAGGLVDVRLKIVDGEKARSLLQEPGNFPTLKVSGSPVTLSAPEEDRSVEIQFEDGFNLFLLYPNTGNVVKPGTPVSVVFGELQVEPIPAK